MIEQWLSNETTTPKPYVERGSIRDRPNAGGAGDLVRLLHAGRISTVNEGTPYSGRWFFKSSSIGGSSLAILSSSQRWPVSMLRASRKHGFRAFCVG